MLERIKNFALYGDTDRENYQAVKGKIEASNRISSLVFSSIAAVLIAVMLLLSFRQQGLSSSKPVYLVGFLFSLVIIAVSLISRKHPMLTYVAVYLAVSAFLIYGIAIGTLTRPDEQTVTFMVLLIFVPLVFVDRPIRMGAVLLVFIVAFIAIAKRTKAEHVLAEDITDANIYGLLAIISQAVVNRIKIRGYVLENQLHVLSETDQLTGLNNRNCYEYKLGQYPGMYKESICCVYFDANGLHELNNQKGHQAGDEMLRQIADAIQQAFGSDDTYRIGGDEFVAFALDHSQEDTERKISEVRIMVEAAGYHVSIGYEYGDGVKFSELVSHAEANMYRDKAEYYKKNDLRQR